MNMGKRIRSTKPIFQISDVAFSFVAKITGYVTLIIKP